MSEELQSTNGNGAAAYGEPTPAESAELRALEATYRELTTSIFLARQAFMRQAGITYEGDRDEYRILGYPRIISTGEYRAEYNRGGIAGRIIDVMPDACWRGDPPMRLVDDNDPQKDTEFEKAWKALDTKHQICAKFLRVDKMSRLSTFAVLLIGALGELQDELPKPDGRGLLYLMPFSGGGGPTMTTDHRSGPAYDYGDCVIHEFETDSKSERFGLPKTYQIKRTNLQLPSEGRKVHWSRVIHIAENLMDDEVYGPPCLERVFNLLIDLRKVTGGGAEAFWLRANQGTHIDVDKDLTG